MAEIDVLELPSEMLLTPGFSFALHMHTILEDAEIVALMSKEIHSNDGRGMIDQMKPKYLKS